MSWAERPSPGSAIRIDHDEIPRQRFEAVHPLGKGRAVNLTLPPSSSYLPDLRRSVAASLGEVDELVVADVLLALDEAVSNAIRHGSRGGEPVQVSVESDGQWVEMTVRDGGPTPHLPRLPAEPPPVLQTGGRGLWLILQLVDEVRLQRIKHGTRLTMRRRVSSRVDSMVGPDGGD
jgi:serine/threonine-protein kinase RsbW